MIPRHVDCLTGALHTARIEVQYPLGDSPHHLRKALVRRKDWRMKDLELQDAAARNSSVPHGELFEWFSVGEERFYVIWHVQWEAVQGESFELLSDAERKFEQLREVYKALQRSLAVTGLLVDASYRERRFLGVREDAVSRDRGGSSIGRGTWNAEGSTPHVPSEKSFDQHYELT
eukprot:g30197.t1